MPIEASTPTCDGVDRSAARDVEVVRPDELEALEQLVLADPARPPAVLELVEPGDLVGGEPAVQVRAHLDEHLRRGR